MARCELCQQTMPDGVSPFTCSYGLGSAHVTCAQAPAQLRERVRKLEQVTNDLTLALESAEAQVDALKHTLEAGGES